MFANTNCYCSHVLSSLCYHRHRVCRVVHPVQEWRQISWDLSRQAHLETQAITCLSKRNGSHQSLKKTSWSVPENRLCWKSTRKQQWGHRSCQIWKHFPLYYITDIGSLAESCPISHPDVTPCACTPTRRRHVMWLYRRKSERSWLRTRCDNIFFCRVVLRVVQGVEISRRALRRI